MGGSMFVLEVPETDMYGQREGREGAWRRGRLVHGQELRPLALG